MIINEPTTLNLQAVTVEGIDVCKVRDNGNDSFTVFPYDKHFNHDEIVVMSKSKLGDFLQRNVVWMQ